MNRVTQLLRLLRITQVFVKHGLDDFVVAIHLFRPYRFLLHLAPWRWRARVRLPRAQRLREALEELGPIFVKFGQMLSTRPDLLPEDIAAELARLQDQVPPFPGAEAIAIIERAYGAPLATHLAEFDPVPIASASVAQVHVARLHSGEEVVVKVLRPGIRDIIERDVALLYTLARLARRYSADGRRLRPVEIVDEYNKTVHDELDLMREAANASQVRANFAGSDMLYVPKIYWEHTRREILVMERVRGIAVTDLAGLHAAGVDLRRLAYHGVEIFYTQVFRDGFFHADMHPGNIFVFPDGRYCAVDFGIMGSISESDKRYLAENFLAFFNRDYRGVAEAHLRAGWVPPGTRIEEFEAAIRAVCEPIFARPIKDISFGRFLMSLFQTARRFHMEVQPQLVLLQKTLLYIEGLGRRLYPELDLWDTAKPYLEKWMREQFGPRAFLRALRRQVPLWARTLPELPNLVHEVLRRAQDDTRATQRETAELRHLRRQLADNQRRLFLGLTGAVLVVGGFLLSALDASANHAVYGVPLAGLALGAAGVLLLVRAWPRKF